MENNQILIAEYLQRIEERQRNIESLLLSQKRVLTFKESVIYSGRSSSNLYKLTSAGVIPHSKPEGKMIYIEREMLENWMLKNPIKTNSQIEEEAATRATLQRKGGAK